MGWLGWAGRERLRFDVGGVLEAQHIIDFVR